MRRWRNHVTPSHAHAMGERSAQTSVSRGRALACHACHAIPANRLSNRRSASSRSSGSTGRKEYPLERLHNPCWLERAVCIPRSATRARAIKRKQVGDEGAHVGVVHAVGAECVEVESSETAICVGARGDHWPATQADPSTLCERGVHVTYT